MIELGISKNYYKDSKGNLLNVDEHNLGDYSDILGSQLPLERKKALMQEQTDADNYFIDKELQRGLIADSIRAGIGGGLIGLSLHPILNIPYVGTGIGGALGSWGDSINHKESALDTLGNIGKGFVIGETIGAVPYIGKLAGKTKTGAAVASKVDDVYNQLANTKLGQTLSDGLGKVEDVLMQDVPFLPTYRNRIYYHGTNADFDKFDKNFYGDGQLGKGFYFTSNPYEAKRYGDNVKKAYLEIKKPFDIDADINVISKQLDIPTKELENMSVPDVEDIIKQKGFDGIIGNDFWGEGNDYRVVFEPEQIKNTNPSLAEYLKNDSILTKGYRKNKEKIDNIAGNLYKNIKQKFPSINHYKNPKSDFILPDLNIEDLELLGKGNKPVIIKPNIIDKNKNNHPELNLTEYNNIIENGLYNAKHILQTQPVAKPNYYNFVSPRNGYNDHVLIELNINKDNYEIVGWHIINDKGLKAKIKTANKNGGQSIITDR